MRILNLHQLCRLVAVAAALAVAPILSACASEAPSGPSKGADKALPRPSLSRYRLRPRHYQAAFRRGT